MSKTVLRVICVGEAMLELTSRGSAWGLSYGGDTLNMAVHCARLGHSSAMLTALGDDSFTTRLCEQLVDEGLDPSLILSDPRRPTGLYGITTSEAGERSFTYWRNGSAASAMFDHPGIDAVAAHCLRADLFHFSLISLAVLPEVDRYTLISLALQVRAAGGRVSFDGNYRSVLWDDPRTARRWRDAGAAVAHVGLPTLDDERALSGFNSPFEIARHWQAAGTQEVVVKLGAAGCCLTNGEMVCPTDTVDAIDTSGAGDAFDAGYLTARLSGQTEAAAAASGNCLAGWVVTRKGAIPPVDAAAPYPILQVPHERKCN